MVDDSHCLVLVLKQEGKGSTLISLTIRVWVIKQRSDGAQSLAIVGRHVLTLAGKVLRGRLQVGWDSFSLASSSSCPLYSCHPRPPPFFYFSSSLPSSSSSSSSLSLCYIFNESFQIINTTRLHDKSHRLTLILIKYKRLHIKGGPRRQMGLEMYNVCPFLHASCGCCINMCATDETGI